MSRGKECGVARLTRKELKKDPFLSVYYDDFVEFATKHYPTILGAVVVAVLAGVAVYAWRGYKQRENLAANMLLGAALDTFHSPVGSAGEQASLPGTETFSVPKDKYQAALKQFTEIYTKFPGQEAGAIAFYHIGLCQERLGENAAAVKTLEQASHTGHPAIDSLARFALANELATTGKLGDAQRIYEKLASHPTVAVPAPTALLALADADRAAAPAAARQIYERLAKEYASDRYLAETVKQELSTLPR
jgi:tetratricopeptide (TPR) repeat protein